MTLTDWLMGRKLTKKEIPKRYWSELKEGKVQRLPSMKVEKNKVRCLRCGTEHVKQEVEISSKGRTFYYCTECIGLGRIESDQAFYHVKEKQVVKRNVSFQWQGELTDRQQHISERLVTVYQQKQDHLIHAVTGAGKTEMLFELIEYALSKGHRIAVASPRVDVCLELYPRFKKVFPKEDISLLYGKQTERYVYTTFVVCTTHQLLRCHEAFDLIVVDEIDAFPYADNAVLEYGTQRALKKSGRLVYLTATPSEKLMKRVKNTELEISFLSKRYHGYLLPVPEKVWCWDISGKVREGRLPYQLNRILQQQSRQCLLFFPNIELMKESYELLQKRYPKKKLAYVYANKIDREEIVASMRKQEWDWLLTTTILERGVTFPNIDVLIIQAEHSVFNVASLVQISGRVGRVSDYPTGHVYFIHSGQSKAMKNGIKQIKNMNKSEV